MLEINNPVKSTGEQGRGKSLKGPARGPRHWPVARRRAPARRAGAAERCAREAEVFTDGPSSAPSAALAGGDRRPAASGWAAAEETAFAAYTARVISGRTTHISWNGHPLRADGAAGTEMGSTRRRRRLVALGYGGWIESPGWAGSRYGVGSSAWPSTVAPCAGGVVGDEIERRAVAGCAARIVRELEAVTVYAARRRPSWPLHDRPGNCLRGPCRIAVPRLDQRLLELNRSPPCAASRGCPDRVEEPQGRRFRRRRGIAGSTTGGA